MTTIFHYFEDNGDDTLACYFYTVDIMMVYLNKIAKENPFWTPNLLKMFFPFCPWMKSTMDYICEDHCISRYIHIQNHEFLHKALRRAGLKADNHHDLMVRAGLY